jgi:hypothetical protein
MIVNTKQRRKKTGGEEEDVEEEEEEEEEVIHIELLDLQARDNQFDYSIIRPPYTKCLLSTNLGWNGSPCEPRRDGTPSPNLDGKRLEPGW